MMRLLYPLTTANVDVTGTTTETTWVSWNIPANTLKANGLIHVVILFDFLKNTGGAETVTLRVKYGATTMFGDASASITDNAARRDGRCEFWLAADGATNAQLLRGYWVTGAGTAVSVAGTGDLAGNLGNSGANWGGSAAEDSTADKTLLVSIQHSGASGSLSSRLLSAFIEAAAA